VLEAVAVSAREQGKRSGTRTRIKESGSYVKIAIIDIGG
jgi:hypothetical protein